MLNSLPQLYIETLLWFWLWDENVLIVQSISVCVGNVSITAFRNNKGINIIDLSKNVITTIWVSLAAQPPLFKLGVGISILLEAFGKLLFTLYSILIQYSDITNISIAMTIPVQV